MSENPHPLHLIGGGRDASNADTELQRLRSEIEARNRQETAIAELGQAALTGVEPLILLGQACALVEITLGVDHARALEIRDERVSVAASIGSNATFLHCTQDNEENESIANDFLSEHRDFELAQLQTGAGVATDTGAARTWPHRHDTDGFFAIGFRRIAG